MSDPCLSLDCAPITTAPLDCAPCCPPPPPPTPCQTGCASCAAIPSKWSFTLDGLMDVFAVFNGSWVVTSLCNGDPNSAGCQSCNYTFDDGTVSWDLGVAGTAFWVLTGQSGDVVIQYWLPQPQWECNCPNVMHRITPGRLQVVAAGFGCNLEVDGCGLSGLNGSFDLFTTAPFANRHFPCTFENSQDPVWRVTINPDGSVVATGLAAGTFCGANYTGAALADYCGPFTLNFTGVFGTNFAIGDPQAIDPATGLHCFEDSTYPPTIMVAPNCTAFNAPLCVSQAHGCQYSLQELIFPPFGVFDANLVQTDCVAGQIIGRPPGTESVTLTPVDCMAIETTYCGCCACDDPTGGDNGGAAPIYNLTVPETGDPCADAFAGDFFGIGGLFVTDPENFPCRWQALDPGNSARVLWTLEFTGACGDPFINEWTLFSGGDLASAKLIYKNKTMDVREAGGLFACLPGGDMHLDQKTCDQANETLTLDMGPCGPLPDCGGTIATDCCPDNLLPAILRLIITDESGNGNCANSDPPSTCTGTYTLKYEPTASSGPGWYVQEPIPAGSPLCSLCEGWTSDVESGGTPALFCIASCFDGTDFGPCWSFGIGGQSYNWPLLEPCVPVFLTVTLVFPVDPSRPLDACGCGEPITITIMG